MKEEKKKEREKEGKQISDTAEKVMVLVQIILSGVVGFLFRCILHRLHPTREDESRLSVQPYCCNLKLFTEV